MNNKFTNLFPEGQPVFTIIEQQKNDVASGETNDETLVVLNHILVQLKIMNVHLASLSDERVADYDVVDSEEL